MKEAESEEQIGFIKKVLGIVTTQLTFTFLLCVLSSLIDPIGRFFKHPATLILSIVLLITCACVI